MIYSIKDNGGEIELYNSETFSKNVLFKLRQCFMAAPKVDSAAFTVIDYGDKQFYMVNTFDNYVTSLYYNDEAKWRVYISEEGELIRTVFEGNDRYHTIYRMWKPQTTAASKKQATISIQINGDMPKFFSCTESLGNTVKEVLKIK